MACPNKLCNHLIISESVTFTDPNLIINIPAGSYNNNQRYCLAIGQDIPATTTIAASVGIIIGDDTTIYPLVNSNCTNVSACKIIEKGIYPVVVKTNIQSGVFKLLENLNCCNGCSAAAPSLPIPTTQTQTTGGEG